MKIINQSVEITKIIPNEDTEEGPTVLLKVICNQNCAKFLRTSPNILWFEKMGAYQDDDNTLTFIKPKWVSDFCLGEYETKRTEDGVASIKIDENKDLLSIKSDPDKSHQTIDFEFMFACAQAELYYKHLIALGQTPQQASCVLSNSIKCQFDLIGTTRDWQAYIESYLRAADPNYQDIFECIYQCVSKNLI